MPTCRVRYRFRPDCGNLREWTPTVDAVADEEREPDDFGNPGRVVRRKWVSITSGPYATDETPRFKTGYFKVPTNIEPIGGVAWSEGWDGDVGA